MTTVIGNCYFPPSEEFMQTLIQTYVCNHCKHSYNNIIMTKLMTNKFYSPEHRLKDAQHTLFTTSESTGLLSFADKQNFTIHEQTVLETLFNTINDLKEAVLYDIDRMSNLCLQSSIYTEFEYIYCLQMPLSCLARSVVQIMYLSMRIYISPSLACTCV